MNANTKQIVREELLAIAAERNIETNPYWNTKLLANHVTQAVLARRATRHARAWESRRALFGASGRQAMTQAEQPTASVPFWTGE